MFDDSLSKANAIHLTYDKAVQKLGSNTDKILLKFEEELLKTPGLNETENLNMGITFDIGTQPSIYNIDAPFRKEYYPVYHSIQNNEEIKNCTKEQRKSFGFENKKTKPSSIQKQTAHNFGESAERIKRFLQFYEQSIPVTEVNNKYKDLKLSFNEVKNDIQRFQIDFSNSVIRKALEEVTMTLKDKCKFYYNS